MAHVMGRVNLSEAALTRFKNILSADTQAIGIRIGLKKAGCTGYMYYIDVVSHQDDRDIIQNEQGINIYINMECMDIVKGTFVDYQQDGLSKKFTYKNPKVKMMCGCGDSFTVQ